jgi:hypothetical protein
MLERHCIDIGSDHPLEEHIRRNGVQEVEASEPTAIHEVNAELPNVPEPKQGDMDSLHSGLGQ